MPLPSFVPIGCPVVVGSGFFLGGFLQSVCFSGVLVSYAVFRRICLFLF